PVHGGPPPSRIVLVLFRHGRTVLPKVLMLASNPPSHVNIGRTAMADKIRRADYQYVHVPDKPGEGARILGALKDAGVNLLSLTAFPDGNGTTQIDFVTENADGLAKAAKSLGLKLSDRKRVFFIQGDDRAGAGAEVGEKHEIEGKRRRQDRVAAQEVDLDLHRIAEPADQIDVVPSFLVVAARRVVVDAHAVDQIAVQIREELGIEDRLQGG